MQSTAISGHKEFNLFNSTLNEPRLQFTQQCAHVYDNPERRALAQPGHDVTTRFVRGASPSRLAHHADAHDESNVRQEIVRCAAPRAM